MKPMLYVEINFVAIWNEMVLVRIYNNLRWWRGKYREDGMVV